MVMIMSAGAKHTSLLSILYLSWIIHTAKIEGLLLPLCGYLSFIVGNLQVIIQLYRSSTKNSLHRDVFYMTASQSCMLLIIDTKYETEVTTQE